MPHWLILPDAVRSWAVLSRAPATKPEGLFEFFHADPRVEVPSATFSAVTVLNGILRSGIDASQARLAVSAPSRSVINSDVSEWAIPFARATSIAGITTAES
jgi:hypothetical protein